MKLSRIRLRILLVLSAAFLLGLTVPLRAGPVFDPFVQDFQVGAFTRPQDVELSHGFPAGLLAEAVLDTVWIESGLDILQEDPATDSPHLTLRLLAHTFAPEAARSWQDWHAMRLEQLQSWPDTLDTSGRYLLADRLRMGFFRSLRQGDLDGARALARRLEREHEDLDLPAREGFVWELRQRLLGEMLKREVPDAFWAGLLDLGTFDTGTAWNLWVAHRRAMGEALLPPVLDTRQEAAELAVLRRSGLTADDLRESAFPEDVKGALGARLLEKDELREHLADYPDPPSGSQLQGWWTYGQRMSRRGETGHYRTLADNPRLGAGWRLDVWRRISEIHLLAGRWEPGLKSLERSLDLAREEAGSQGLRRRLRQWCEQALVLALAQGRSGTAENIAQLARTVFTGEEGRRLQEEIRQWFPDDAAPAVEPTDRRARAQARIARGEAPALEPVSEEQRQAFRQTAVTPLWGLWARWGLSLIEDGDGPTAAREYRRNLQLCLEAGSAPAREDLVVAAVAGLLDGILPREPVLRWSLEKDIHHAQGGRALISASPLVVLARENRDDPLYLHGLLGLALLLDDMRAIVGAATPLPTAGLTEDEKLCFLYPLPRRGAVHEALRSAGNDPALILAVARNESLFEPAVRSRAGALGFMQIMPFHYPQRGARPGAENWSHAGVSIAQGDALLTENRRRYDGNPYLSLAAYNAGPGAVARWRKQLGGIERNDIFLAWIGYPETRRYVEKVLKDREIYDWIIRTGR